MRKALFDHLTARGIQVNFWNDAFWPGQAFVHKIPKPDYSDKYVWAKFVPSLCLRNQNPKEMDEHAIMPPGL